MILLSLPIVPSPGHASCTRILQVLQLSRHKAPRPVDLPWYRGWLRQSVISARVAMVGHAGPLTIDLKLLPEVAESVNLGGSITQLGWEFFTIASHAESSGNREVHTLDWTGFYHGSLSYGADEVPILIPVAESPGTLRIVYFDPNASQLTIEDLRVGASPKVLLNLREVGPDGSAIAWVPSAHSLGKVDPDLGGHVGTLARLRAPPTALGDAYEYFVLDASRAVITGRRRLRAPAGTEVAAVVARRGGGAEIKLRTFGRDSALRMRADGSLTAGASGAPFVIVVDADGSVD